MVRLRSLRRVLLRLRGNCPVYREEGARHAGLGRLQTPACSHYTKASGEREAESALGRGFQRFLLNARSIFLIAAFDSFGTGLT